MSLKINHLTIKTPQIDLNKPYINLRKDTCKNLLGVNNACKSILMLQTYKDQGPQWKQLIAEKCEKVFVKKARDGFQKLPFDTRCKIHGSLYILAKNASTDHLWEEKNPIMDLKPLADAIQKHLFEGHAIHSLAKNPSTEPLWGEKNAFADLKLLAEAIQNYVFEGYDQLPETQKEIVGGRVYVNAGNSGTIDPVWGKNHAKDSAETLLKSLADLKRLPNLFSLLPKDIKDEILLKLDPKSFARLFRVSEFTGELCQPTLEIFCDAIDKNNKPLKMNIIDENVWGNCVDLKKYGLKFEKRSPRSMLEKIAERIKLSKVHVHSNAGFSRMTMPKGLTLEILLAIVKDHQVPIGLIAPRIIEEFKGKDVKEQYDFTMTNSILEESLGEIIPVLQERLKKFNYKAPGILEILTLITLTHISSNKQNPTPLYFKVCTLCSDPQIDGNYLMVSFTAGGLFAHYDSYALYSNGTGAMWQSILD